MNLNCRFLYPPLPLPLSLSVSLSPSALCLNVFGLSRRSNYRNSVELSSAQAQINETKSLGGQQRTDLWQPKDLWAVGVAQPGASLHSVGCCHVAVAYTSKGWGREAKRRRCHRYPAHWRSLICVTMLRGGGLPLWSRRPTRRACH